MKKIIFVITLMFLLVGLVSCDRKSYKEYIPDDSQYADWDGNYFYYANYRCKSNLTDEETVINEVTYDSRTYKIDDVNDCKFKDDKLYLIFPVDDAIGRYDREIYSLFIIYSYETNEIEYMYKYEEENENKNWHFHEILLIEDWYLIVESDNYICKLDLTTNEVQVVNCDSFKICNEYIVITVDNEIFVANCDDFNFESIITYHQSNVTVSFNYYVELIDGRPILIIHEYVNKSGYIQLKCYDLKNKEMVELVNCSSKKRISFNKENSSVFILGDEMSIEFSDEGISNRKLIANNILYRIRADKESVYLEEVFVFNSNIQYIIDEFNKDLICLISTEYSKSFLSIHYNKIKSDVVYFDITTKSFLDCEDVYTKQEVIDIAEFNGFNYYFKREYYYGRNY